MSNSNIEGKATALAEPVVDSHGMELVDVEFKREPTGWVLRIFIDKEGGVDLDDCSLISRELGTVIEVEEIIEQHYTLEVSSPGLTRRIKKLDDFDRFKGKYVKLKCYEAIEGSKNMTGKLLGVDGDSVILEKDAKEFKVLYKNIAKANLEFVQEG
ncbi:MAG: ribosome maturation factor RimP [bacterium]|nr:ribosome maturation factor RimP [bacterium]